MSYKTLYWEDVIEGQELPAFEYEVSLLRLVAFARATGLLDYVHYDRDYAQAVGMRDAFIAGPHVEGLLARLLTDWSGPEGVLRSLSYSLRDQCCTNDVVKVSGKVAKKYQNEQGEYLVDIEALNVGHALAASAAAGSATMSMPSKTGVKASYQKAPSQKAQREVDPSTPEFAKAMMGQVKNQSWNTQRALTEHETHLWCEALEDWNPLYWDKDHATKSRHGGLIAPPAQGWFFGAGTGVTSGVGYLKPGAKIPEAIKEGLTGQPLLRKLRAGLIAGNVPFPLADFPELVMVVVKQNYYEPIRPGDTVHSQLELLSCGPLKRTKVGEGHFMDYMNACYNQRDELAKTMTLTQFAYRP